MSRKYKHKPTSVVSVRLLQEQLQKTSQEYFQVRNVLFAILKEQGRVRISKETIASLGEDDRLDAKELSDGYVVTYVQSNMVIPGGVTNGHANAALLPKETA